MAVVTPEIIQQVALLARLRLDSQELAILATQLDEILQYVQQLQSVPTDGVEPTSHVLPLRDVLRPDQPSPSLNPDTVVHLAPASQSPFIAVPKVLDA